MTFVVAIGVLGCESSSYRPANSPRVSTIYERGVLKYRRNGKTYDDVLDAVDSNPRAAAAARSAASKHSEGSILAWSGFAVAVAGGTMAGVGAGRNDDALLWSGFGTAAAGLIVELVGVVIREGARLDRVDAMNIYNDDLEAKMYLNRPAPAPTGTPATPTPEPR